MARDNEGLNKEHKGQKGEDNEKYLKIKMEQPDK